MGCNQSERSESIGGRRQFQQRVAPSPQGTPQPRSAPVGGDCQHVWSVSTAGVAPESSSPRAPASGDCQPSWSVSTAGLSPPSWQQHSVLFPAPCKTSLGIAETFTGKQANGLNKAATRIANMQVSAAGSNHKNKAVKMLRHLQSRPRSSGTLPKLERYIG